MSNTELYHLIKMLNQIADNFTISGSKDEQTRKIADHVKRFWAPSMIQIITQYAQDDGKKLKPASLEALSLLEK